MAKPPHEHTLASFDQALGALRNDLLMMASLTERNFNNAMEGVLKRNSDRCNITIADDEEVDELEKQVDHDGYEIIFRFQPVASDLRAVVTAMKLSQNLERVADQSVSIARKGKKLNHLPALSEASMLEPMFHNVRSLLKDSLRSYIDQDVELALKLKPQDREIDDQNREFADTLTERMTKDPENVAGYLNLIFIARSLERIGDHATNIAEDAVFVTEARDIRHQSKPPKAED